MKKRSCSLGAFSLVEVVVALSVAAFVLVALLGLVETGYHTITDSSKRLEAVTAASAISTRWRSILTWNTNPDNTTAASVPTNFPIDMDNLPKKGKSQSATGIYVTGQGLKSAIESEQKFRLSYEMTRSIANPATVQLHLCLSWPAAATNPQNSFEIVTTSLLNKDVD